MFSFCQGSWKAHRALKSVELKSLGKFLGEAEAGDAEIGHGGERVAWALCVSPPPGGRRSRPHRALW